MELNPIQKGSLVTFCLAPMGLVAALYALRPVGKQIVPIAFGFAAIEITSLVTFALNTPTDK
ncbi:MAG: hypothetical protein AB7F31_02755 [Parachlamydiales bacterium]